MSKTIQDDSLVDFSNYSTVFCDSTKALEWAYQNGLSKSAIIKSSAPALLFSKNRNIQNIEKRWTVKETKEFQKTIQKLTEDIFDIVLGIPGIEREFALAISQFVYKFQRVIFKAACLDANDFTEPRLFIYVYGKTGPSGNMMNSLWDQLLFGNPSFTKVDYKLENDKWSTLTTYGVSYWRRFKVAGYETIVYRLAMKLMNSMPSYIFKKEILIPNENELNIEIASSLALHGVRISKIKPEPLSNTENIFLSENIIDFYKMLSPIISKRVRDWVEPSAVDITMSLFKGYLEKEINQFKVFVNSWEKAIGKKSGINKAVLVNSPGNLKGFALACACRKNSIPLISSQHGVTVEISKAHSMLHVGFDNGVADAMFSYNQKVVDVEQGTYFDNAKHYIVGMPMRLIRMKYAKSVDKSVPPIVYISTNLYHMGFSISSKTDYHNAMDEQSCITEVLSKLPHKVRYKTYPEDNRRYADPDPVLNNVKLADNIELFFNKIDMRYLIDGHSVLVTSCATSTLGWVVMSEKPVIFIDWKDKSPLSDDAYASILEGVFVFDDNDLNFHQKLRDFLSQPIDEIEILWQKKKSAREEMIKNYFSMYKGGAGKRAAQIILREYLN